MGFAAEVVMEKNHRKQAVKTGSLFTGEVP